MARKASPKSKKVKKVNPQERILKWFARSVEVVLIFSSLFWAVETSADLKKSPTKIRLPAQYAEPQVLKKLALNFALDSKVPKKVMTHPNSAKRVKKEQNVHSGHSTAVSFTNDPRYVPLPLAEVGRFPTPK